MLHSLTAILRDVKGSIATPLMNINEEGYKHIVIVLGVGYIREKMRIS